MRRAGRRGTFATLEGLRTDENVMPAMKTAKPRVVGCDHCELNTRNAACTPMSNGTGLPRRKAPSPQVFQVSIHSSTTSPSAVLE